LRWAQTLSGERGEHLADGFSLEIGAFAGGLENVVVDSEGGAHFASAGWAVLTASYIKHQMLFGRSRGEKNLLKIKACD
jgi:hypothetical protein